MAQANIAKTTEKLTEVKSLIEKCKAQIAAALPAHMKPERMARIAYSAIQRQPKLLECTPQSLAISVITAGELGLEPNLLGHAYLVPFYNGKAGAYECQLIPGYKGLLKLARNSGEVLAVSTDVVREGDFFEYEKGLNEKLRHIPSGEPEKGREVTHAYAILHMKGGHSQWDVMTRAQLDAIKNASKSKDKNGKVFGPWADYEEEMQKKTVLKRTLKLAPASSELEKAMHLDAQHDAGEHQTNDLIDLGEAEQIEPETVSAPSTASKVESKLAAKKASQEPPQPVSTGQTMQESAFDAEFESWGDSQQKTYMEAMLAAKGEGMDSEDAHAAGYRAATSL